LRIAAVFCAVILSVPGIAWPASAQTPAGGGSKPSGGDKVQAAPPKNAGSTGQDSAKAVSQSPSRKPAEGGKAPASPKAATPSKTRSKPHVYTNDDFDALPSTGFFTQGPELLDEVNDCDRDCFNQVGRATGSLGGPPGAWKQTLFDAIETVKGDQAWQELLRKMIDIQAQTCQLEGQKQQDLRRYADPNNVTPNELEIDREYQPKFAEVRRRLNSAAASADAHVAKSAKNALQAQFMRQQEERISQATCNISLGDPDPADSDPSNDDPGNDP
jgi:hypothetical protein